MFVRGLLGPVPLEKRLWKTGISLLFFSFSCINPQLTGECVPVNSFLQRSRTLSSRFSSWCFTFSYSRSACWLFLLLVHSHRRMFKWSTQTNKNVQSLENLMICRTCSSRQTRRWTAASVRWLPGWLWPEECRLFWRSRLNPPSTHRDQTSPGERSI